MKRTTLTIEGMSCGHCVLAVTKALEGLEGVKVENVSVGAASVEYDPSLASPDDIAGAIADAGYPATAAA